MKLIFAVLVVTLPWTLHVVIKRQFFYIYICFFSTIIYACHIYFQFWKRNRRHIGSLLLVSILTMYRHHHRHMALHWPTKFHLNGMIVNGVMTLYWIFKMVSATLVIYFWFPVWWRLALEKLKDYLCTKFRQDISIHSWDITTSGFWKQMDWPPYWNSTVNAADLYNTK